MLVFDSGAPDILVCNREADGDVGHGRTMAKLNIHEVAGLTRYAVSMGMVNIES